MRKLVILVAMMAIVLSVSVSLAGEAPDLTGKWRVITSEWHSQKQGFNVDRPSHMRFVVDGQKRKIFWGRRTFWDSAAGKNRTVKFSGAVEVNGSRLLIKEHGNGIAHGEIVSPDKLYIYFMEDGSNAKIQFWEIVRRE